VDGKIQMGKEQGCYLPVLETWRAPLESEDTMTELVGDSAQPSLSSSPESKFRTAERTGVGCWLPRWSAWYR
jgi:hypothetical protein